MPPVGDLRWDDVIPTRTVLRGIGWVDSNDLPPGCRRFMLEEGEELTPANIGCFSGQSSVAEHELRGDIFVYDQGVAPHEGCAGLVVGISPLVGNLLVKALDAANRLLAALALLVLLAGQLALESPKLFELGFQVVSVFELLAV